jgi:hypothetical protein
LSLAIGQPTVVHAAAAEGGASQGLLREARRLRRYRLGAAPERSPASATRAEKGRVGPVTGKAGFGMAGVAGDPITGRCGCPMGGPGNRPDDARDAGGDTDLDTGLDTGKA